MSPYIVPGLCEKPPIMVKDFSIEAVIRGFCKKTGKSIEQITQKSWKREIVKYRHALCYFIRTLTSATHREVGEVIAGYDHTTAIHAVQSVTNQLDTDENYRAWLNNIHPFNQTIKSRSDAS